MIKIGSHINLSGNEMLLGASKNAVEYGCNCFMIYTGAPQNTIRKDISLFKINESKEYLNSHNFDLKDIIVHAPYIINLASPDSVKRDFSINFILLGSKYCLDVLSQKSSKQPSKSSYDLQ